MATVKLLGLQNALLKKFKRLGVAKAQERAKVLKYVLADVAKTWEKTIKLMMLTPASARGYTGKHINPHNSLSHNKGFPMAVTGRLSRSIWQTVTVYNTSDGASIKISKGFHPLDSRGVDYGEILNSGGKNQKNLVLRNYKERAYAVLDARITQIAHRKGFL